MLAWVGAEDVDVTAVLLDPSKRHGVDRGYAGGTVSSGGSRPWRGEGKGGEQGVERGVG